MRNGYLLRCWSRLRTQMVSVTLSRHGESCSLIVHNMGIHVYPFPLCQCNDQIRPRKLGLLGGTFEDGSFTVYAIPDPADVKPQNHDNSQPVFGANVLFVCEAEL